jgi:hypothetical protein
LHSFVVLCETNILSLVSQNLNNFYQIQTKCYKNSDTVFFSPIHRTKRGLSWAAPTWRYINQSTSHAYAWFTSIGRVTSPPLHLLLPLHSLGTTIHARQTGQDRTGRCRNENPLTTGRTQIATTQPQYPDHAASWDRSIDRRVRRGALVPNQTPNYGPPARRSDPPLLSWSWEY